MGMLPEQRTQGQGDFTHQRAETACSQMNCGAQKAEIRRGAAGQGAEGRGLAGSY